MCRGQFVRVDVGGATEIFKGIRKLPLARGYRAQIIAGFFVVIAIILAFVFPVKTNGGEKERSSINQVGLGLYCGLILTIAEFLRRFCNLGEEIFHLETRYENKKIVLLHKVFGIELATSGTVTVDIIAFAICCYVDPSIPEDTGKYFGLSSLVIGAYLLYFGIIKSNKNPVDLDKILDQHPIIAAQAFACGHFVGYIQLLFSVVKDEANHDEDFLSRVEKFEKDHNIQFASKKLHIIIPDAGHLDRPLAYFGMTEFTQKIGEKTVPVKINVEVNRGGRMCKYPINICKLNSPNSADPPLYVMVDVPRTLSTLKAIKDAGYSLFSLNPSPLCGQLQAFGVKLKNLIADDVQCRDHVEITSLLNISKDSSQIDDNYCNEELAKIIQDRILQFPDPPSEVQGSARKTRSSCRW